MRFKFWSINQLKKGYLFEDKKKEKPQAQHTF